MKEILTERAEPFDTTYTYQTFGVATFNGVMSIALHSISDRIN